MFRTVILRHFRFEWGKLLLSVSGVAIGVAVFTAIRLANTTVFSAFTSSLDAVAGRANLQVLSNDGLGFGEELIGRLRGVRAVQAAAPVVEQYAMVDTAQGAGASGTPVLVFGIDVFSESRFRTYNSATPASSDAGRSGLEFLRDPDAIIITKSLAALCRVGRGDTLHLTVNGRRLKFRVADIVLPEGAASALGGNFALLDIAAAQEAFDRLGRLDRIDLLVGDGERGSIRDYLRTIVPVGVSVDEPANRSAQSSKMVAAFDLNLTALAFIALFVAVFIIYNTMLTNTLRRRRELGILRALGATQLRVGMLFVGEAAVIGLIGVIAGLPLGILLARAAVTQVAQTVTALYILTVTKDLVIDPVTILLGAVTGILASVLAAVPSAMEAARASPRETFSVQTLEEKVAMGATRIILLSLAILLAAFGASLLGQRLMNPLFGFLSAGLVLLGFALITPLYIRTANALFGRLVGKIFGIEGALANGYLLQSLGRASTAIAALTSAVAMLVGVSTMVGSFRNTVEYWLGQTIRADLYVTIASNRLSAGSQAPIPGEVVRYVDSLPEAVTVDALRRTRLQYGGQTITVNGSRMNLSRDRATLWFMEGDWSAVMRGLDTGAIAVGETFALRFGKSVGDTVVLATPTGTHSMPVAGVYYDYTTESGTVMMKKGIYSRLFADTGTTGVSVYLRDATALAAVRSRIEKKFSGGYHLVVYSNRSLRDEAMGIFDQTFAITYALQLVAMIVAGIGVANTLAALVLERSREIGIMRAIGASSSQIRKMTLVQAGLIGSAAQVLGVMAGLALSAILIYVINRASFGWTIRFTVDPVAIAVSAVLVVISAFVAGLGPANAAARKRLSEIE